MRIIVLIVLIFAGIVTGISFYLSPDDLARCEQKPDVSCQEADAVVAISGGDTAARTNEAIELYENDWADKLVFSGAALDKSGPSNAAAMRDIALAAGVPDDDIIIEEMSETTKQNAENTSEVLAGYGINSVILVTSGYHQRRAALEFNARQGGGITVRNHPVSNDNQWSDTWWLTPHGWYLAISELTKIIAFYMGGTR